MHLNFQKNESLNDCQNKIIFIFHPHMEKGHHYLQLLHNLTIWAIAGFT